MLKPVEHTIFFTEACPLECRYCFIKDGPVYGTCPELKRQEIMDEIARIDKQDNPQELKSILLLTGGEPFLFFDLIKEIMEKYGNRFVYKFNTSGFPLDKEKIEFLSHYDVEFVLSVDGDDRLTNYLRPVKANISRTGYMKKLREIIPTLLYYFPNTPYRIIISPRYVDTLHQMYLFAENLGFRYFTFILDFESRPNAPVKKDFVIEWTDEYTEKLKDQLMLIVGEILTGFKMNIWRPEVIEINNALYFLSKSDHSFTPDDYPCKIFNGRSLVSLNQKEPSFCMSKDFPNLEAAYNAILKEYNETNGICKIDPNCPAFDFCTQQSCPKNNLDRFGNFFKVETLDCALKKVSYQAAMGLLTIGEEECCGSKLFPLFLKSVGFGRREQGGR